MEICKRLLNDDFFPGDNTTEKKNKIKELKALKDVGWTFGTDGLSESYLLYKKIQSDKLLLRFLIYIVDTINFGLERFIGNLDGKLTVNILEKDYDQLWEDYSQGKITGKELSNTLYHNTPAF